MLFQRINRSDAEKIFIVAYNSYSSASLTNGQAVEWDHQTDGNGVSVTKPTAVATSGGLAMAGVAAETIASGSYGLIQVYGYHSAVRVKTMTTTGNGAQLWKTVAKGTPLGQCITALFALEGISTASTSVIRYPVAFALAVQGSNTTKATAAFIKAM